MVKVYESTERLFNHNGIRILKPYKSVVFLEDNGDYYLELEVGLNEVDYIKKDNIVMVSLPWGEQCFRLENPSKTSNKINIKGRHLYFDTERYVIKDANIVDKNGNGAISHINSSVDQKTPFTVTSNIVRTANARLVRKSMAESIAILVERWGGHLLRNNFNISLLENIGKSDGIIVKYGKNIKDIKEEQDWNDVVTKILPVGYDGILLPETFLYSDVQYKIPYTKTISFNQDIKEEDYANEAEYKKALIIDLRKQAIEYLNENKYPKVNYTLKAHLDSVGIGDEITVKHENMNIDIKTNVISIKYDVIAKKYLEIEFGNFKTKLKDLLSKISNSVKNTINEETVVMKTVLQEALEKASAEIWSVLKDSYVLNEGDRLLVVDRLPKELAKNVMIINSAGIGFGKNGIGGTFTSAWTLDGTFNAQNINVINFTADLIKAGILNAIEIKNGNGFRVDKDGNLYCKDATADNLTIRNR